MAKPAVIVVNSLVARGGVGGRASVFALERLGFPVWSVPTVLSEFNRHAPELADFISQVRSSKDLDKVLSDRFAKLPRISFAANDLFTKTARDLG